MKFEFPSELSFKLPKRFEVALLVVIALLLFLMDLSLNKAADLGLDYQVTIFGDIMIKAIVLFWFAIILYHIAMVTLIFRALMDRGTHWLYDSIVGGIVLFGVAIVLAGAVSHFTTGLIPVFATQTKFINFYHFGIVLQVGGLIYYSLTD